MYVDVKNALDRALLVCESVEERMTINIVPAFIRDIYTFISSVSVSNEDDRCDYFNKVYLGGKYPVSDCKSQPASDIPESIRILAKIDAQRKTVDNRLTDAIISFFLVLGRHYSTSLTDRMDVSLSSVTDQVKMMRDYVKEVAAPSEPEEKQLPKTRQVTEIVSGGTSPVNDENSSDSEESNEPEESLDELLEKLNSLIGLKAVKQEVQQIINLIKVQKKGEAFGEKFPPLSLHLVFFGNPGTGKTTVARLLAKIYKCLGVLSSGQLVEVDRSGLVAGYVGQTAIKTQEVIDKAMGGILFIDEAYSLTHGKSENDFGQEAVDTILKAMEDHRDDFIVIVAGYPELMREFVASNPGLKSRFNQFINFEDYTPDELKQIFLLFCKQQNLVLADGCNEFLQEHFAKMYRNRSDYYANGRDVRNYFEKVTRARANRLVDVLDSITREEYMTIVIDDLHKAASETQSF